MTTTVTGAIRNSLRNISELRALEPAFDGQQVELLGHTVKGIGGGPFYHDAASVATDDNGVTIVTPEGKRWVRKLDGIVQAGIYGNPDPEATLRAYTPQTESDKAIIRGVVFQYDSADVSSSDNGVDVYVTSSGARFKRVSERYQYQSATSEAGAEIKFNYGGAAINVEIADASIREHCILWHPYLEKYLLIADVVYLANPNHPNTYDSEIELFTSADLSTWTRVGVCIAKGGVGSGQGAYGVASPAGAAIMDDGTVICPFSSRDSSDFVTRTIGVAVSGTNPEAIPWTKQSTPASTLARADDPAIVRDASSGTYHLFHRYVSVVDYKIAHLSTDNVLTSGSWVARQDANDISLYTSVDAQELTAAFSYCGCMHLICMEQIVGVGGRDSVAHWVSPNAFSEFRPLNRTNRHLPPSAFGRTKSSVVYSGHFTPIIQSGVYIGSSFTVTKDIGTGRYGLNIEKFAESKFSRFKTRCDTGQSIPASTNTDVIYNLMDAIDFDANGDYNTGTGVFTVPATGYYDFDASVMLKSVPDGVRVILELQVNGSRRSGLAMTNNGSANDLVVRGNSGELFLNSGDLVKIRIFHNHGAALLLSTDPTWQHFSGKVSSI